MPPEAESRVSPNRARRAVAIFGIVSALAGGVEFFVGMEEATTSGKLRDSGQIAKAAEYRERGKDNMFWGTGFTAGGLIIAGLSRLRIRRSGFSNRQSAEQT